MQCPICKKLVKPLDDPRSPNPHFPFCGDRCKLIDLGRWLSGKYQISARDSDEDSDTPNFGQALDDPQRN